MQLDILESHLELSRFLDDTAAEWTRLLGDLQRRHMAHHIAVYRMFGDSPLVLRDPLGQPLRMDL